MLPVANFLQKSCPVFPPGGHWYENGRDGGQFRLGGRVFQLNPSFSGSCSDFPGVGGGFCDLEDDFPDQGMGFPDWDWGFLSQGKGFPDVGKDFPGVEKGFPDRGNFGPD